MLLVGEQRDYQLGESLAHGRRGTPQREVRFLPMPRYLSYTKGDTMSTNLKGRATASFDVSAFNEEGRVTITIIADSTGDEWEYVTETVQGTVALGKLVAELGKVATPITASERRLNEQVAMYVAAGLDESEAEELASQVNSL